MVNIAADKRATSDGAVNSAGSAKPSVITKAPRKPSRPANSTVHALAVVAIPATQASMSAPQRMNGQARRSSELATASSTNEAGSWPKLSAVSALPIKSARPAPVRWPGRKALLQKYMLLTLPKRKPICQISLLLQSGHQLRPFAGRVAAPSLDGGASSTIKIAIASSGRPQTTKLQRQELSTSGRTTGS